MPAAAGNVSHMDSRATDGSNLGKVAISLGRHYFDLASLANLLVALGIRVAKQTLWVNAVTRVGSFVALRAERSRHFRNDGDGLKSAHTTPNSRQTDKISMAYWAPQASLYTGYSIGREESDAGCPIVVNNSHRVIAFDLSLAGQSATMGIGWYSERISAAGSYASAGSYSFGRTSWLASIFRATFFAVSKAKCWAACLF